MLARSAVSPAASGSQRIADALDDYYRSHELPPDGGASDRWFRVRVGPLSIPLPNIPARRRAVVLHDINHLITGYDTTLSGGEMEIGAFEIGASCGRYLIAWYLDLSVLALGLVVNPRRVFAGFVRGRRSTSLYRQSIGVATLRDMTVAEVRSLLQLDQDRGTVRSSERLAFAAWSAIAVPVFLLPFLPLAALLWLGVALMVPAR